jgi:hypothetical protein
MSIEDNHRWPKPNHNFVPEYQMSGIPYAETFTPLADGSRHEFTFDQVTRWVVISSTKTVQIGFNDDGNIHTVYYFQMPAGISQRFELKCKSLVIKNIDGNGNAATVSVLAGLTNVVANTFPDQTNDNGFKVE